MICGLWALFEVTRTNSFIVSPARLLTPVNAQSTANAVPRQNPAPVPWDLFEKSFFEAHPPFFPAAAQKAAIGSVAVVRRFARIAARAQRCSCCSLARKGCAHDIGRVGQPRSGWR